MLDREQMTEVTALVQGTRSLIERELAKAEVTVKGAADYVTNVDFAVQDYLKTELEKRFPQISVIAEEKDGQEQKKTAEGVYVESPMVGTFYAAPSQDAEPFVQVGDRVSKGQTVGIVEAMKLMNVIESECDGVVKEILVKNEQMVEYGQRLIRIAAE